MLHTLRMTIGWLALLLPVLPTTLMAQTAANVTGELVADVTSVQPGEPFTAALRLVHAETWHTYWQQPGDAGLATEIIWDDTVKGEIGAFQWPVPKAFLQDDIVNNVYENEVLLRFTVTPPADLAPGTTYTLSGMANWLECDPTACIPGGAEISLSLPVVAETPEPSQWATAFTETQSQLPVESDFWQTQAWRDGDTYQVRLIPTEPVDLDVQQVYPFSELGQTVNAVPADAELDAEVQARVDAEGKQVLVTQLTDGSIMLQLTQSPYFLEPAETLPLVLKYAKGWPDTDAAKGLRVTPLILETPPVLATETASAVETSEATSQLGILGILLAGYLGGLILNLMPCVFPVIGLKIMGFVNQAGEERSQIVKHGLMFTLGVLLSFWVLAGFAIVLGATWGFQMENPNFVLGMMLFFMIFGLNMAGVFEVGGSAVGVGSKLTAQSGLRGSFFSGLLATVVATPCSAPFLAQALGATVTLSAAVNFVIFTMIALGLSTPYLVLSLFPQLVKKMPRPGPWMESLKQGLSFLLFGFVGYLVYTYSGQLSALGDVASEALRDTLIGLVVIALACWIFGRWATPSRKSVTRKAGTVIALLLVVVSAAYLFRSLGDAQAKHAQILAIENGDVAALEAQDFLIWEDWSEAKVQQAIAAGRTVYIDFTARWCATCQVNKRVYKSDKVIDAYLGEDVLMLRADKTVSNPEIDAAIRHYGHNAIPLNVLHMPDETEPRIMPAQLNAGALLEPFATSGGDDS